MTIVREAVPEFLGGAGAGLLLLAITAGIRAVLKRGHPPRS
ncbi:hypothetical protein [Streptomyces sp. NPDC088707]